MSARKCCTINGAQSSFPRLLRKLSREDFEDDSDEDDDFYFSKRVFLAFLFFDENSKPFFVPEREENHPRESRDGFCVCGCCICAKEEEDEVRRRFGRCPL